MFYKWERLVVLATAAVASWAHTAAWMTEAAGAGKSAFTAETVTLLCASVVFVLHFVWLLLTNLGKNMTWMNSVDVMLSLVDVALAAVSVVFCSATLVSKSSLLALCVVVFDLILFGQAILAVKTWVGMRRQKAPTLPLTPTPTPPTPTPTPPPPTPPTPPMKIDATTGMDDTLLERLQIFTTSSANFHNVTHADLLEMRDKLRPSSDSIGVGVASAITPTAADASPYVQDESVFWPESSSGDTAAPIGLDMAFVCTPEVPNAKGNNNGNGNSKITNNNSNNNNKIAVQGNNNKNSNETNLLPSLSDEQQNVQDVSTDPSASPAQQRPQMEVS